MLDAKKERAGFRISVNNEVSTSQIQKILEWSSETGKSKGRPRRLCVTGNSSDEYRKLETAQLEIENWRKIAEVLKMYYNRYKITARLLFSNELSIPMNRLKSFIHNILRRYMYTLLNKSPYLTKLDSSLNM